MKVKRLFSALLAAVMVCSLLCVPAFAADKASVLEEIDNYDSIWVGVTDVTALKKDVTVRLLLWDLDSEQRTITKMAEPLDPQNLTVYELPLGVTLAAGPENNWVSNAFVYSDPDGDGVYELRVEKDTYELRTENGETRRYFVDAEMLPAGTTGTLRDTDTVEYWVLQDWGYGANVFEALAGDFGTGYRTITTDYLVELFGANTLIEFWPAEGDGNIYILLTGEEKPENVELRSLADNGIYFSKYGDVVSDWAVDVVNDSIDKRVYSVLVEASHDYNLTGHITRAEFAAIAVNLYMVMADSTATYGDNPFTDVDESNPYYKHIVAAYDLGVVTGKTTTTFAPDAMVTRQEAAAMLSRVYKAVGGEIPTVTATSFADDSEMENYARDAVAFMAEKGIINGVGSNRFKPKENATVEQALKIAVTMLEELG